MRNIVKDKERKDENLNPPKISKPLVTPQTDLRADIGRAASWPPPRQARKHRRTANAILVKVHHEDRETPGRSFATVVATLESTIDFDSLGVTIDKTRKTKVGDLLLEIGRDQPTVAQSWEVVASTIGGLGQLVHLQGTVRVRIDATVTEEETKAAIDLAIDGSALKLGRLRCAAGGQ